MKKLIILIISLMAVSCAPVKYAGTGYHVVIEHGRKPYIGKFRTIAETDIYVNRITDLDLKTDSLIGDEVPAYRFDNFEYDVYVEEKDVYTRGKREIYKRKD